MIRTLHSARRSLRAALRAGSALVSAVRGAHYRLLVALYAAIDTRAVVRIRYQDQHGAISVRDISPRRLWLSGAGDTLVTAFDHRDQDQANFRTDRIAIAA